ncbi:hypothetical protein [Burkholderia pseudomallei]|uniref:hypothetical protein n=1 Tax=Burkholderia pseudomallei TaxID=28450 RepID=UPI0003480E58|nr:hypothetical protein [Burkholderia pseudomallei]OMZ41027.1 hypothetical protein AQ863_15670 [Burkholderia pseudomallei]OMZ48909.1 hypothetical protein AQ864_00510 [Burkholderia pseudomallei]OMZ61528.1 hypothetical protein AQ866_09950 [Burkholderia pseudomallei]OMZ68399.1 hypothetical protein AQ867_05670 [Burkholderia pseudomallei]OMZ84205.1 hypothetical protein AQ868_05190 [Burkholderia pseudomallei]
MEIAGDRAFGAAIAARGFRRGAAACRHRARTRATGAATIRDTPGNRRAGGRDRSARRAARCETHRAPHDDHRNETPGVRAAARGGPDDAARQRKRKPLPAHVWARPRRGETRAPGGAY